MTTLTLYKGVAFDGVNSFPHITTKSAFDSYLTGKQQYSQAINFNRIGEPILINESYDTAIGYSYGCIDTGGKKYYIIPDSLSVNENNRVHLTYSVDWFTTLEYGDAIAFGRAHLIKSTDVDPLRYPQGIQPNDMRISSVSPLQNSGVGEIFIAYTRATEDSEVRWIMCRVNNGHSMKVEVIRHNNEEYNTYGISEIIGGYLIKKLDIPPANVIGIHYIPFETWDLTYRPPEPGALPRYYEETGTVQDGGESIKYVYYMLNPSSIVERVRPPTLKKYKNFNLTSNAMNSVHLVDRYGSIIYSVPYGRTLKRVTYQPIITTSACYVAIEFFYADEVLPHYTVDGLPTYDENGAPIDAGDTTATKNADNSFILYMCEKIDYNNDAYANWAMGLKGVEIEERRIQKNKSLASGLGGSVITGAIGGAGGNPIGAGLGLAGGLASAYLSYGIETRYESEINALEDRKYQLAQDTMVPGGFIPNVYPSLAIVTLTAPTSDIARYNDELANFGADCNLPVSSWTPSFGAYKFADVEVIADVPYSIKQNIKQKMLSGIKIVRLS